MLWELKNETADPFESTVALFFSSPNHPVGRTFTASFNMPEITRKLVRLPKPVRLYRNPVYLAEEWRNCMKIKGFSQADLARDLGVSRARVTQVMNVLKRSKDSLEDLRALGDPMVGKRMTERMLR